MSHPYSSLEAIVYDFTLDVRFADLDPYGHLNSAKYLDLVNTSRLIYLEREIGVKVSDLIERNIGFYMSKATQEFLRPVKGLQKINITSRVEDVQRGKLSIPYEIRDVSKTRIHSKGILDYYVIDLTTQKPTEMPSWMVEYFFHNIAG